MLLSSLEFAKKDNQTLYLSVRALLSRLVVCSINMLFSDHVKMSLYEQAYGLTYLRIFVHYFLGLLLVLFLLALSNIWLVRLPLVKAYIVVTLVFYTVLNYINVDIIIARNNINLYFQTGKLDVYYLQGLSYDALPELTRLDNINNQDVAPLKKYLLTLKEHLASVLSFKSSIEVLIGTFKVY